MQQLDDRTGAAIRLSARMREDQRAKIVYMIGELSKAVDALTVAVEAHERRVLALERGVWAMPWRDRVRWMLGARG